MQITTGFLTLLSWGVASLVGVKSGNILIAGRFHMFLRLPREHLGVSRRRTIKTRRCPASCFAAWQLCELHVTTVILLPWYRPVSSRDLWLAEVHLGELRFLGRLPAQDPPHGISRHHVAATTAHLELHPGPCAFVGRNVP